MENVEQDMQNFCILNWHFIIYKEMWQQYTLIYKRSAQVEIKQLLNMERASNVQVFQRTHNHDAL